MTIEELNKIISQGEGTRIEFKQANSKAPSNLYETVCSFLNREGGTIVLGVDDEGTVMGIDPGAIDQLKKDVITSINNKDVIDPPVNFPLYVLATI